MDSTMSDKSNILVICRELGDLPLLDQVRGKSQQAVIVASDNIDVQQPAEKRTGVTKACFIELTETMYDVADDVLRIRGAINQWMASLVTDGEGVPKELLFFEHHAEGGMTTQRIQDSLLLIRSYRRLFEENSVSHLVLRRRINSRWEDDALVQTARSSGIQVEEYRSIGYSVAEKLRLLPVDRHLLGRIRRVYIPKQQLRFLQRLKLYVDVVRARLRTRNRKAIDDENLEIAFLLGASSDKHVKNILPLMNEFQHRGTYRPIALCWRAAKGAAKVRFQGLPAIEFEAWVPLSRVREVWRRVRRTRARIMSRQEELQRNSNLSYEGVALIPLIQPSLDHLINFQVYDRFFLRLAAERYFSQNRPEAIKTWGDSVLDLGAICHDIVQRVCKPPSLMFHYSIGTGSDWPYAVHNSDVYLAADELEKRFLIRYGADPSSVVVTGQARYDHLPSFQEEYSKDDSREYLGLPSESKLYAFYVLGYPIRGLESRREFLTVASKLLEFFKQGTNGTLLIKPHPSDSANSFGELKRAYPPSDTIFWYDKGTLPYHCVNAADVVITKMSTVGIESILLGVPLVSISLDSERRYQEMYGDVPERLETLEGLLAFLKYLCEAPQNIYALEQRQRVLRQRFLNEQLTDHEGPAAGFMADVLKERLRVRQTEDVW
jgi:hypothetical protein